MTQEDVANAMGKNKMWVSRYENSAMQKLRKSVL